MSNRPVVGFGWGTFLLAAILSIPLWLIIIFIVIAALKLVGLT